MHRSSCQARAVGVHRPQTNAERRGDLLARLAIRDRMVTCRSRRLNTTVIRSTGHVARRAQTPHRPVRCRAPSTTRRCQRRPAHTAHPRHKSLRSSRQRMQQPGSARRIADSPLVSAGSVTSNGPRLPVWSGLPVIALWLLPSALGLGFQVREWTIRHQGRS